MKLYSIQPVEVAKLLKEGKTFICDPEKSGFSVELKEAYAWIVIQMEKRFPKPSNVVFPIWAWHTYDWKRKLNLEEGGFGIPGTKYACLELEVPDEQVLLSDFDNWHAVLNGYYLADGKNKIEWEENHKWFDSLPLSKKKIIMKKSWEKIFNVTPINSDWIINGQYIQATFWEIKPEYLRNVIYFIDKEMEDDEI